jgi:menaquinone-specific isochorismate synthase
MESLRGDEVAGRGSDPRVVARSRELDGVDRDRLLAEAEGPTVAWRGPEETVEAAGATATLTADGPDRFAAVRAQAEALFDSLSSAVPHRARPRLFGGFAFHDGRPEDDDVWTGFADAWFVLPRVQVTTAGDRAWLTTTGSGPNAEQAADRTLEEWTERLQSTSARTQPTPPGVLDRERTPSKEAWNEQVRDAIDEIEAGRLRKVVLAQSLSVELAQSLSVPDALARLDETYPDCYRFAFTPPEADAGTFFGATPERLVSLRGRTVETEALAGSTGRGDTPAEDEWLAEELLDSEKDIHEHQLVVEAVREQLDPVAASVSTGERAIRRLATVQHLRTPIRATLSADEHVLSLVEALHPTPAVGGLPPDAALETIRRTEAFDRGWYAAPVGWMDAAGNGTFTVAIRSALARQRRAWLFAGAGIVADSDPDREWDEVQLKYRPMLDELE